MRDLERGGKTMSIESRFFRAVIAWLWVRYPYLMMDIVIGGGRHIHRNPKKRIIEGGSK